MDGVGWDVILQLNQGADLPDLAVILNGSPAVIAARLAARRRAQPLRAPARLLPTESDLYADTAARLAEASVGQCAPSTSPPAAPTRPP